MSFLRIIRLGARIWDMYRQNDRLKNKPETEDEPPPPPTQVDEAKNTNVAIGRAVYWGCVNRTYHVTGDRESVPARGRNDQTGATDTGLKIYVGCVIENYHFTTDRAT
ncbi:Hypp8698 [Branchiostoma lanceolatum]|uniref:Hypp8698 protein n=1 Tax=Branchiostoma lanceolatum TaxID=7740 RepID=A0A8K0EEC2_BRALA|nr:Hypp8698 [Branchiostoma lanceolatum]